MKTVFDVLGRHTVHPFPARMAPTIALEALRGAESSLRVLDPMAGSGTVLAVARAAGHRAVGVDSDPLAVLLSRVWTTAVDHTEVITKAHEVLKRAREVFASIPVRSAYPRNSDDETGRFVRFWFDDYVRRQLASLSTVIQRIRTERIRDVLWCSLSRLIINKRVGVSLAMDLSHSRPHKVYDRAPIKPFNEFLKAVNRVVHNCPLRSSKGVGPPTTVINGDARVLSLRKNSVDLVVTSPPYLNAIDYLRCSKFSLVWMGYDLSDIREIRRETVGTERRVSGPNENEKITEVLKRMCKLNDLSSRDQLILQRYVSDMDLSIREVARVLRPGGRAVYVVGDSTLRGTFIGNSDAVSALAERSGLQQSSKKTRELPPNRRYLPPPSSKQAGESLQNRIRTEVVLEFEAT